MSNSPFKLNGMSFKAGQTPLKNLLGDVIEESATTAVDNATTAVVDEASSAVVTGTKGAAVEGGTEEVVDAGKKSVWDSVKEKGTKMAWDTGEEVAKGIVKKGLEKNNKPVINPTEGFAGIKFGSGGTTA